MKADTVQSYTRNRNADAGQAAIEAQEHAGELVARSLDGRRTIAYGTSVDELHEELSRRDLPMSDVVIEWIEYDVVDLSACRDAPDGDEAKGDLGATPCEADK